MKQRLPNRNSRFTTRSVNGARAHSRLAACTIISRNYLSHAKILAQSYARHEPGGRLYVLVVDRLPAGVDLGPHVHVVDPGELAIPHFAQSCFKYDVTELCTAVKAAFLSLLFERYEATQAVYFDPDILILNPLDGLKQALQLGNAVLTPHLLRPIPRDGFRPSEQDILLSGAYNLGFIALKKSVESKDLLQWWQDRLRDDCRVDPSNAVFVDQRWVDLVPGMFPSTAVLNDEAYNVAYWNIHSRTLERRNTQFFVNGKPLVFFHFSGFDPAKPRNLSKHQNRTEVADRTALAALLDMYAALHYENGYAKSSSWEYGYARFDNGVCVNTLLRQIYLDLDSAQRRHFRNPFQTGSESFLDWATRPEPEPGNLSLFLQRLYQSRADVAAVYRDPVNKDRSAFIEWRGPQGYARWVSTRRSYVSLNHPTRPRSEPRQRRVMPLSPPTGAIPQDSGLRAYRKSTH